MGSKPEALLVVQELELLRQPVLAELEQLLLVHSCCKVQHKLEHMCCMEQHRLDRMYCKEQHRLARMQNHMHFHTRCHSNRHSNRLRSRNRKLPVLLQPDDVLRDRNRPEHRSEQKQHMGCSSIGSCEADRQFHQLPSCEHLRQRHSDRRRKHS